MNRGRIIGHVINISLFTIISSLFGMKVGIVYFVGVLLGGIEFIIGGYDK